MSYLTHLECADSGRRFPADRLCNNPSDDGDVLEARYDLARLRREVRRQDIGLGPPSLWRYAPLLPVARPAEAVTLGEGWTPLLPLPAVGADLGCPSLFLKDESRNPSGTFKDRGASVGVSRLKELGVRTVVLNSSGNAGGAWALYAARAGVACVNLLPDDVLPASLQQSALAGAQTFVLRGPWRDSGPAVARAAARHGWFDNRTLREPYRLEGKKTMGYEIAEQMGWRLPDAIVYPTGGALGAIAIYKAFRELRELGWIEGGGAPKLIVTQYAGCAPVVRAFERGREDVEPWQTLDVLPGGLKSPSPPGGRAVLRILRETGGAAIAVSTEDALAAAARLARREGIFACPESATTVAGLEAALARGLVGPGERIVLVNTGSGLKSIPNFPPPRATAVNSGDDLAELRKADHALEEAQGEMS
jgi:threonine synthase